MFTQHLIKGILATSLVIMTFSMAQASHTKVVLGPVQLGGSCKDAEVSTRMDRTTGHFIIAPENYVALIENGSTLARKTCLFSIPFEAKPNRAVRIRLPKIKGSIALDQGSMGEINYEIFFSGLIGEKTSLSFTGNENIFEKDFDETSTVQEVIYECGKSGIIRGNSSILVRNNNPNTRVALIHVQKFGIKIDSIPCQ